MAELRYLKDADGNIIYPVTHTDAIIGDINNNEYQTITDTNLSTGNKTVVGAINEIYQNVNNGKQLIADAIGNPLVTNKSTFETMSEAILGLRRDTNNETDAKEVLYNMMIEDGYDEATSEMTVDELIQLLDDSQIEISEIKQIFCGYYHTFIIKNDGSVWSCGYNYNGELGLGDTDNRTTFTQVNISDVKQITCGYYHTFILKNDGSVWSCGKNNYGQLGLGDTTARTTFTQVTTNIYNDVKQIVCGDSHTFILKNDDSVWACGLNSSGQLGLGDTTNRTTFTQVTTNINNDVKQIICGYEYTFILKNDGSLWSCGLNDVGQLGLGDVTQTTTFTQVTTNINNDVKQVACGGLHAVILKNDGSVWSCGKNSYGQLGLGNNASTYKTFTQVTTNISNDVKQIICGLYHTFIIKNDGTIWTCGRNKYGQLGLGNTTDRYTFTKVTTNINNDIKQVACGYYFTVILKNDGSAWSCGYNNYGQLGFGDITDRNIFTQVPFSSQSIDEYEMNRQKLYYYLLDNEVEVTESMDIGAMLDLLVDNYVNNMINDYYNNLKLVLIDEGIEVTEEDDMNDLIVKVDEELDRKNEEIAAKEEELANSGGLDIISAAELPATGNENQICVITDTPFDSVIISTKNDEIYNESNKIILYSVDPRYSIKNTAFNATINNFTYDFHISKIKQGNVNKESYYYRNNIWNELSYTSLPIVKDGAYTNYLGTFTHATNVAGISSDGSGFWLYQNGSAMGSCGLCTSNNTKINFSDYTQIKINLKMNTANKSRTIQFGTCSVANAYYNGYNDNTCRTTVDSVEYVSITIEPTDTEYHEYILDISNITGEYYIYAHIPQASDTTRIYYYFKDIEFI